MKVIEMFNFYFNRSGFIDPFNDFIKKERLPVDQEKIIYTIYGKIVKSIEIIVQIHNLEKENKNENVKLNMHLLVNGLHCDFFINLASIYLFAKDLFFSITGSKSEESEFWKNKYNLSNEDNISFLKQNFKELVFINNSMLFSKFRFRSFGGFAEKIYFQCNDSNLEHQLASPHFSTDNGLIRTKYYAQFSMMQLFNYLLALGKYISFDEFGKNLNHKIEYYRLDFVMKDFLEVGEEWMNMTN